MQTMDNATTDPTLEAQPEAVVESLQVETQATETPDGSPQNENYKSYVKRLETTNKSLKAQVIDNHIADIGLDPATGLGVAVREGYDGDEFTLEAVAAFAETKYGHVAQAPEPSKVTEVRTQQQVADVVTDDSTPLVPTNTMSDDLVKRENAMNAEDGTAQDAADSLTAKVAAYRQANPM